MIHLEHFAEEFQELCNSLQLHKGGGGGGGGGVRKIHIVKPEIFTYFN